MTTKPEMRRAVADAFRGHGFSGRTPNLGKTVGEIRWMVNIGNARQRALNIMVGLAPEGDVEPRSTLDCPVSFDLAQWPGGRARDLFGALHLDANMSFDERQRVIEGTVREFDTYISQMDSLSEFAKRIANGEYRMALIRKELRSLLAGQEDPNEK